MLINLTKTYKTDETNKFLIRLIKKKKKEKAIQVNNFGN